jgi:hypothetical protein
MRDFEVDRPPVMPVRPVVHKERDDERELVLH